MDVNLVTVYASVRDEKGRLVTHLRPRDFQVYEDGRLQHLVAFSNEYVPLSVSLLIDFSRSMSGKKILTARKALVDFAQGLRDEDEMKISAFNDHMKVIRFSPRKVSQLKDFVRRISPRGSTILFDALAETAYELKSGKNPRKVILVISDGADTSSTFSLEEAVRLLRASGANLYAVGIENRDRGALATRYGMDGDEVLQKLTMGAGGHAYFMDDDENPRRITDRIRDELKKQYALSYVTQNKRQDATWRSIEVRVNHSHLNIQTSKRGYYAPLRP